MGIIEDRPSSYGEMVFALGTVELFVGFNPRNLPTLTPWAGNALGPAQFNQNFAALVVGVEQPLNV
jgi:hypothetical protein